MINGDDEITNLKLMICNLDLSVGTKEKLYNQVHKIRNKLEQKENIIKEVREYIEQCQLGVDSRDRPVMLKYLEEGRNLLEILDKENK